MSGNQFTKFSLLIIIAAALLGALISPPSYLEKSFESKIDKRVNLSKSYHARNENTEREYYGLASKENKKWKNLDSIGIAAAQDKCKLLYLGLTRKILSSFTIKFWKLELLKSNPHPPTL